MIGYHIRYRLRGRVELMPPVPLDVGSRAEAVQQWKGFKLGSPPERCCIQLWRGERLVAGEEVRLGRVPTQGVLTETK